MNFTRRDFHKAAVILSASALVGPAAGRDSATEETNKNSEKDTMDDPTALRIPAQIIPVPTTISPEAQAFLANAAKAITAQELSGQQPDPNAQQEAALPFLRRMIENFAGKEETIDLPHGTKLYCATPPNLTGRLGKVAYFDIHGGGFIVGGGEMCKLRTTMRAMDFGMKVFSVDYRLLPDHPYPNALNDCMAAYREILKRVDAADLVIGGSSAGGNLAAALMLRARDEGLPLPAGLLLLTPGLDMTQASDSYRTNRYLDVNLHGGAADMPYQYAAAAAKTDPYVSPIYGDFSKGWPPTILSSGTRDLLLSDTVRMHRALRRAGIDAELHITEAGPHGGFMGTAPEDREILGECKRFIAERLALQGQNIVG